MQISINTHSGMFYSAFIKETTTDLYKITIQKNNSDKLHIIVLTITIFFMFKRVTDTIGSLPMVFHIYCKSLQMRNMIIY